MLIIKTDFTCCSPLERNCRATNFSPFETMISHTSTNANSYYLRQRPNRHHRDSFIKQTPIKKVRARNGKTNSISPTHET